MPRAIVPDLPLGRLGRKMRATERLRAAMTSASWIMWMGNLSLESKRPIVNVLE